MDRVTRLARFSAAVAAAACMAGAVTGTAAAAGPYATLSDEKEITRWAHPRKIVEIRADHAKDAKTVAKTRRKTEDGFPEVYLALRSYTDDSDQEWIQIRIPTRPNGKKGWVTRESLGSFKTVTTLFVINRRSLRATLYRNGKRIWREPVGVGEPGTPTPAGRFWVREKFYTHRSGTIYGPFAFGTAAYSRLSDWPGGGVVGIHGTNQPGLIPGRPSHGCVRVRNRAILRLAKLMPVGTPVRIL
jgi:lipoprotein-anchoring transpeptidase ErfK/SrfK